MRLVPHPLKGLLEVFLKVFAHMSIGVYGGSAHPGSQPHPQVLLGEALVDEVYCQWEAEGNEAATKLPSSPK